MNVVNTPTVKRLGHRLPMYYYLCGLDLFFFLLLLLFCFPSIHSKKSFQKQTKTKKKTSNNKLREKITFFAIRNLPFTNVHCTWR